jgi:hypothetical protein
MSTTANQDTSGAVATVAVDPISKLFASTPHQAYSAEDVVRKTDPKTAKDPQKLQAAAAETAKQLAKRVTDGTLREVGPGLFKTRLFFDSERMIEHAFLGGMEGVHYAFQGPLFRLNIGVLSAFFVRDVKNSDWTVTVRDSTIGKDYCLILRPKDGSYLIGSAPADDKTKNYLQIPGRYIAARHVTVTLDGEKITVEDLNTLDGTRVDHLTEEGLSRYRELAGRFLKETAAGDQANRVKRGRFVLNQFIEHHQNFEATFFNAVTDSLLMAG